jgi:hypothetical protein
MLDLDADGLELNCFYDYIRQPTCVINRKSELLEGFSDSRIGFRNEQRSGNLIHF